MRRAWRDGTILTASHDAVLLRNADGVQAARKSNFKGLGLRVNDRANITVSQEPETGLYQVAPATAPRKKTSGIEDQANERRPRVQSAQAHPFLAPSPRGSPTSGNSDDCSDARSERRSSRPYRASARDPVKPVQIGSCQSAG